MQCIMIFQFLTIFSIFSVSDLPRLGFCRAPRSPEPAQERRRRRGTEPDNRRKSGPGSGPGPSRIEPEVGLECLVERHKNLRILSARLSVAAARDCAHRYIGKVCCLLLVQADYIGHFPGRGAEGTGNCSSCYATVFAKPCETPICETCETRFAKLGSTQTAKHKL